MVTVFALDLQVLDQGAKVLFDVQLLRGRHLRLHDHKEQLLDIHLLMRIKRDWDSHDQQEYTSI